jgi:Immunity protein 8
MTAVLKSISTIEGNDPSTFRPDDEMCFSLWLRLYVGPSDGEGSESFDVLVCSPGWLARQSERDGFVVGRHHLVVNAYRYDLLRDQLAKLIGQFSGSNWSEVAAKVGRIGYWEFEDYAA